MKKRKRSLYLEIVLIIVVLGGVVFALFKVFKPQTSQTQYQTVPAEKGNIIATVSASGQVSYANSAEVTTQVFGTVTKLYVKNGDTVTAGQRMADLALDQDSQQTYLQALSSYQNAKNSLENARITRVTLKAGVTTAANNFLKQALNKGLDEDNATYLQLKADKEAAEAKFANQDNVITQAQTALSNAGISLRQVSPTIYAPIAGTVSGLTIQPGSVISEQSSSNANQIKSQKIANITTAANPVVDIDMTEIDIPKIKVGQKATITFDALPGKTFTGVVTSIDTTGAVSSGVTTFPVILTLDTAALEIYVNMSATANIITDIKNDVIIVPTAAVQNQNNQDYVRVLKDGAVQDVPVEVGIASDTEIEIISGVSQGDQVITAVSNGSASKTTSGSASPFGILRPSGSFGGGRRD